MRPRRKLVVFEPHKVGITKNSKAHNKLTNAGIDVLFGPKVDATPKEDVDKLVKRAAKGGQKVYATTSRRAKIGDSAMPHIDHIFVKSKGVDKPMLESAKKYGTGVSNTVGHLGPSVAEHAIGLGLSVQGDIHNHANGLKEGKWRAGKKRSRTIAGSNVAVLGTGEIGSRIAKIAGGMGANVTALNNHGGKVDGAKVTKSLREALKDAHMVFLALPVNEKTEGIIGRREFKMMSKNKPVVVNVGRANLIQREALHEAIDKGHISGFGTDVHYDEDAMIAGKNSETKLAERNPDIPVLQTPHIGYHSDETKRKGAEINMDNIISAHRGRKKSVVT
jgi:phosphoglycerate dehydrogenase-like enzyme